MDPILTSFSLDIQVEEKLIEEKYSVQSLGFWVEVNVKIYTTTGSWTASKWVQLRKREREDESDQILPLPKQVVFYTNLVMMMIGQVLGECINPGLIEVSLTRQ